LQDVAKAKDEARRAGPTAKKHGNGKDTCWFFKDVYDVFGVPHDRLDNESTVLNMIAAKLSQADCELLVRSLRALKNAETH
jgi:hypothetical protein